MRATLRARMLAWARPRQREPLPARFDRRRIYILPTRFGLFYAVLLLVMLLGALNYNNNPALLLGFLLGGAGLASLVAAQLQLAGLAVIAVDAEPVAAGSNLLLRVHAQADAGRVRRGLRVELERVGDASVGIAHGQAQPGVGVLNLEHGRGETQVALATARRGWLQLPRVRVGTTRPLGLARAWAWAWPQHRVLVYPAAEAHGPALPVGGGDSTRNRLQATGDDVHHLRNYRSGDSRRAIAWKASARRDTLLVREYEQPMGGDIVLDWHGLQGLPSEARIARLARWVEEAEAEPRRYRLQLPGQPGIGPEHGPAHRHACLRALALLPHG